MSEILRDSSKDILREVNLREAVNREQRHNVFILPHIYGSLFSKDFEYSGIYPFLTQSGVDNKIYSAVTDDFDQFIVKNFREVRKEIKGNMKEFMDEDPYLPKITSLSLSILQLLIDNNNSKTQLKSPSFFTATNEARESISKRYTSDAIHILDNNRINPSMAVLSNIVKQDFKRQINRILNSERYVREKINERGKIDKLIEIKEELDDLAEDITREVLIDFHKNIHPLYEQGTKFENQLNKTSLHKTKLSEDFIMGTTLVVYMDSGFRFYDTSKNALIIQGQKIVNDNIINIKMDNDEITMISDLFYAFKNTPINLRDKDYFKNLDKLKFKQHLIRLTKTISSAYLDEELITKKEHQLKTIEYLENFLKNPLNSIFDHKRISTYITTSPINHALRYWNIKGDPNHLINAENKAIENGKPNIFSVHKYDVSKKDNPNQGNDEKVLGRDNLNFIRNTNLNEIEELKRRIDFTLRGKSEDLKKIDSIFCETSDIYYPNRLHESNLNKGKGDIIFSSNVSLQGDWYSFIPLPMPNNTDLRDIRIYPKDKFSTLEIDRDYILKKDDTGNYYGIKFLNPNIYKFSYDAFLSLRKEKEDINLDEFNFSFKSIEYLKEVLSYSFFDSVVEEINKFLDKDNKRTISFKEMERILTLSCDYSYEDYGAINMGGFKPSAMNLLTLSSFIDRRTNRPQFQCDSAAHFAKNVFDILFQKEYEFKGFNVRINLKYNLPPFVGGNSRYARASDKHATILIMDQFNNLVCELDSTPFKKNEIDSFDSNITAQKNEISIILSEELDELNANLHNLIKRFEIMSILKTSSLDKFGKINHPILSILQVTQLTIDLFKDKDKLSKADKQSLKLLLKNSEEKIKELKFFKDYLIRNGDKEKTIQVLKDDKLFQEIYELISNTRFLLKSFSISI